MLLGIGGDAELEGYAPHLHRRAVGKEAVVETVHLVDELQGVGVTARRGLVHALLPGLVAA